MTTVDGARDRGRAAQSPARIPARGWKDVLARTAAELKADHVPLLAAGVAFFGLLASVPALVAFVSTYGLVADPASVADNVTDVLGAAPQEVRDLATAQLRSITESEGSSVGLGAVLGIVVALWSASSGMKHLVDAINTAYDEDETRGFVRVRLLALALTAGAVLFVAATIFLVAVLPSALDGRTLGSAARAAFSVARWPVLAVAMLLALAVVYRWAPDRDEPKWRWVTPGAVVATVLWLAGSALFSVYAASFGTYNETYGSLGGVVVAMLWLFLTAFVVIGGAELNAELEHQTAHDSTEGRPRPLGRRGAYVADNVGPTAEEVRRARAEKRA